MALTHEEIDTFIRKVGFEKLLTRIAALYPEWDIVVSPSDSIVADPFRRRRLRRGRLHRTIVVE